MSLSLAFSCAWSVGVQFWSRRLASAVSSRALSPQLVCPSHGAFPVAISSLPLPGSTTAPARPQIAESLVGHEDGGAIRKGRSEHSEFQTWLRRPVWRLISTTCPWYGGASPMYPPVVTITS